MMPVTYLRSDGHSAPRALTGGPRDDRDEMAEQERRMGFIQRQLDQLTKRMEALEALVKKDTIAPLPPVDGEETR